jgi:hypothetical protein
LTKVKSPTTWQTQVTRICFSLELTFIAITMVIDTLALRENFQMEVRECVKKRDWRKVLLLNQKYEVSVTSETLWTFPTEYCLNYLKALWKSFNIKNILSIGCGSGLLEFVLRESMGLIEKRKNMCTVR